MYALITGFMEAGETPQEGIAREIKEETNLDATELNLIGVYDFQRMNQVIIAYHAVAQGEVKLSPELVDYKLYPYDDVKCWPAGTGYALADWLRGRGVRAAVHGDAPARLTRAAEERCPGRSPGTPHEHRQGNRHPRPELPAAHPEGQEGADGHAKRPAAEGGGRPMPVRCATSRLSPSRPATSWWSSRPWARIIHVLRRR